MWPTMDLELARRTERCEGAVSASFVERSSSNEWREIAGAYAIFAGAGSPLTQTFGLGLFAPVDDAALQEFESYFFERGAGVSHEVSPLAGVAVGASLVARGYRPIEQTSVLVRPLGATTTSVGRAETALVARPAERHERDPWIACSVGGWRGLAPDDFMESVARAAFDNPKLVSLLVERDGRPIATGSLGLHGGVALLAGASTLPEHRGLGAQRALLVARLALAVAQGCDLALMGAEPGSASQRNAERCGFRIAYTRTKWARVLPLAARPAPEGSAP